MQKKKGAIELSLNFIVIVVISIAVLILSFAFVRKIYTGATNTQETYYKQFESQMESLACDNMERVCVGKNRKTIDSNGVAVFTMRVLNVEADDTFTLGIVCDKLVDSGGNMVACPVNPQQPRAIFANNYVIKANEGESFVIAFDKQNSQSGTYIFNVQVKKGGIDYDTPQKLYVVVP